ncbi:MAG TPA: hypothetical protein VHA09_05005 [Nitrososphaera sp.]|nr:hypothetical protein [Nitrososphaera sp.]
MTRDALYERLRSFGVDVDFLRKLDFTDEELAALEGMLARLMKNRRH